MTTRINPIIIVVLGLALSRTTGAQIQRQDFLFPGGAGRLHVRQVWDYRNTKPKNLILLHGGGPGGVPSFDLPVPGYSLAEDFAKRGFRVFVMDVRGWGSSTKPREMDQPPHNSAPLVSTKEAADDIYTVVDWVVRRTHEKTSLLGWASGGHWACAYASRAPAALSALILLNTLYSVNAPWELRASMQDKENPDQFDPHAGGYRIVDRSGLLRRWDTSIPAADKTEWRDPAVADAYVSQTLATDRTASAVIRGASEFRLATKSMRSTFHSEGRCLRRKTFGFQSWSCVANSTFGHARRISVISQKTSSTRPRLRP